jgi:hypothetical protein
MTRVARAFRPCHEQTTELLNSINCFKFNSYEPYHLFKEKGYRFYFLSNEKNRKHVHITCEDGEAKFWMEPIVALAVSHGLSSKKLNEIQGIVEKHHHEIIKAWQKYFGKR